jgi:hypothetical protein
MQGQSSPDKNFWNELNKLNTTYPCDYIYTTTHRESNDLDYFRHSSLILQIRPTQHNSERERGRLFASANPVRGGRNDNTTPRFNSLLYNFVSRTFSKQRHFDKLRFALNLMLQIQLVNHLIKCLEPAVRSNFWYFYNLEHCLATSSQHV